MRTGVKSYNLMLEKYKENLESIRRLSTTIIYGLTFLLDVSLNYYKSNENVTFNKLKLPVFFFHNLIWYETHIIIFLNKMS